MNLDDILADLEKKAGFPGEEDKGNQGGESAQSKDDKKSDDKKDEKKDEKKEGQEKSAAFKSGSDLAKEVMEKIASVKIDVNINKGETNMNKQASDAGKALAQALLKQAGAGDLNTANGITEAVVPHKSLRDQATMKAEHDAVFQATPGTDGAGNGGTINQIFDAIVADAMGRTNAKDDKESGNTAKAEGAVAAQAPNQNGVTTGIGDSQEKSAAVAHLVSSGIDFDDAVSMVKAASDELEAEAEAHVKQAAFNELIAQGVSFDEAVSMIKQASAGKDIDLEKKAALSQLLDAGVDFDSAVSMVESKASQLYGA